MSIQMEQIAKSESIKPTLHQAFAEEISALKANPNCKYCRPYGNKGYYGIGIDPKGHKYLLICCGEIGETEYTRLKKQITDAQLQLLELEQHVEKHVRVSVEMISEQFLWNKIKKLFGSILGKG